MEKYKTVCRLCLCDMDYKIDLRTAHPVREIVKELYAIDINNAIPPNDPKGASQTISKSICTSCYKECLEIEKSRISRELKKCQIQKNQITLQNSLKEYLSNKSFEIKDENSELMETESDYEIIPLTEEEIYVTTPEGSDTEDEELEEAEEEDKRSKISILEILKDHLNCTTCGRMFDTLDALRAHVSIDCYAILRCSECDHPFRYKRAFEAHRRKYHSQAFSIPKNLKASYFEPLKVSVGDKVKTYIRKKRTDNLSSKKQIIPMQLEIKDSSNLYLKNSPYYENLKKKDEKDKGEAEQAQTKTENKSPKKTHEIYINRKTEHKPAETVVRDFRYTITKDLIIRIPRTPEKAASKSSYSGGMEKRTYLKVNKTVTSPKNVVEKEKSLKEDTLKKDEIEKSVQQPLKVNKTITSPKKVIEKEWSLTEETLKNDEIQDPVQQPARRMSLRRKSVVSYKSTRDRAGIQDVSKTHPQKILTNLQQIKGTMENAKVILEATNPKTNKSPTKISTEKLEASSDLIERESGKKNQKTEIVVENIEEKVQNVMKSAEKSQNKSLNLENVEENSLKIIGKVYNISQKDGKSEIIKENNSNVGADEGKSLQMEEKNKQKVSEIRKSVAGREKIEKSLNQNQNVENIVEKVGNDGKIIEKVEKQKQKSSETIKLVHENKEYSQNKNRNVKTINEKDGKVCNDKEKSSKTVEKYDEKDQKESEVVKNAEEKTGLVEKEQNKTEYVKKVTEEEQKIGDDRKASSQIVEEVVKNKQEVSSILKRVLEIKEKVEKPRNNNLELPENNKKVLNSDDEVDKSSKIIETDKNIEFNEVLNSVAQPTTLNVSNAENATTTMPNETTNSKNLVENQSEDVKNQEKRIGTFSVYESLKNTGSTLVLQCSNPEMTVVPLKDNEIRKEPSKPMVQVPRKHIKVTLKKLGPNEEIPVIKSIKISPQTTPRKTLENCRTAAEIIAVNNGSGAESLPRENSCHHVVQKVPASEHMLPIVKEVRSLAVPPTTQEKTKSVSAVEGVQRKNSEKIPVRLQQIVPPNQRFLHAIPLHNLQKPSLNAVSVQPHLESPRMHRTQQFTRSSSEDREVVPVIDVDTPQLSGYVSIGPKIVKRRKSMFVSNEIEDFVYTPPAPQIANQRKSIHASSEVYNNPLPIPQYISAPTKVIDRRKSAHRPYEAPYNFYTELPATHYNPSAPKIVNRRKSTPREFTAREIPQIPQYASHQYQQPQQQQQQQQQQPPKIANRRKSIHVSPAELYNYNNSQPNRLLELFDAPRMSFYHNMNVPSTSQTQQQQQVTNFYQNLNVPSTSQAAQFYNNTQQSVAPRKIVNRRKSIHVPSAEMYDYYTETSTTAQTTQNPPKVTNKRNIADVEREAAFNFHDVIMPPVPTMAVAQQKAPKINYRRKSIHVSHINDAELQQNNLKRKLTQDQLNNLLTDRPIIISEMTPLWQQQRQQQLHHQKPPAKLPKIQQRRKTVDGRLLDEEIERIDSILTCRFKNLINRANIFLTFNNDCSRTSVFTFHPKIKWSNYQPKTLKRQRVTKTKGKVPDDDFTTRLKDMFGRISGNSNVISVNNPGEIVCNRLMEPLQMRQQAAASPQEFISTAFV